MLKVFLMERKMPQIFRIADIKRQQNGWDYADKLNTHVLGIEKPSMKWLRDIIDSKLA